MKRREFLALAKWALGATAIGGATLGAVELANVQPRRRRLPPRFPDDAKRPRVPAGHRSVVVVGGGLAGLSAGIELARRHFDVTLVERAPQLGGKLGGWTVSALGGAFPGEHGFHGFFGQYYNLGALLEEAGSTRDLVATPALPVLFPDRPEARFGPSTHLFPFNLAGLAGWRALLSGHGVRELLRFDGEKTFAALDGLSFDAFLRERGIDAAIVDTLLRPFGKGTLNRVARLSAAEALRFFHFALFGNPDGLQMRVLARDSMSAVIDPLRRLFESLGGQVRTGVAARRLVREGNAIRRVELAGEDGSTASAQVGPGEVPERGYLRTQLADGTPVYVARRQGRYLAFDAHCTHMGCTIGLDESDPDRFRCPCHGGRFDAEGRPVSGPPQRPLRRVSVRERPDGGLALGGDEAPAHAAPATSLPCDHCVVACEVRGTKALVARSDLGEPGLEADVAALGEADPYVVLRLWLDRAPNADRLPFYALGGYRYLDAIALYSRFQEPYVAWARGSGGSVGEVHAYAIAPEDLAPPAELRARMIAELFRALPELAGAKVLHHEYLQQDNFTRWAPGDHARRPGTETPISNLFFAGDWVKLDAPAFLMEGAVMSGKLAANGVLDREGLQEAPIDAVPATGPLVKR